MVFRILLLILGGGLLLLQSSCSTSLPEIQPSSYIEGNQLRKHVIVFVHGVTGDGQSTWTYKEDGTKTYWPDLVYNDPELSDYDVFVVSYFSPHIQKAITIHEAGRQLNFELESAGILSSGSSPRYEKLIFVGHSMGNLVIRDAMGDQLKYKGLHTPLHLSIASPSAGSDFAGIVELLSHNPQYRDLVKIDNNAYLQKLNENWKNNHPHTEVACAYETLPHPLLGRKIVDHASSNFLCTRPSPMPIDRDHDQIVKPQNSTDQIHRWLKLEIKRAPQPPEFSIDEIINILRGKNRENLEGEAEKELRRSLEKLFELRPLEQYQDRVNLALGELKEGNTGAAEDLFKQILEEEKKAGTQAMKRAAEAARHLGSIRYLNSTYESLKAYQESTQLDPENPIGWNQMGHLLSRLGRIDEAFEAYQTVLQLGEKTNEALLIAVAYGNLGNLYRIRGHLDEAESMYQKAIKIDEELGRKEGMANQYGNLGNLYMTRGDLNEAESMYQKAIKIDEELGRKEGMAIQYGNLGILYMTRGDLDEAESMYQKAIKIDEELGSKEGMAIQYANLGILYSIRGDLDEAESMYQKALPLNEELGSKEGMAIQYGNLGILYMTRGDLDEAESLFQKALPLNEELGRKEGMASDYANLGILYKTRGDLDEAESMYQKALKIDEELGRKEGMANQYGNLGNLYGIRGNLDEAESMYQKALTLNEELGRKKGMAIQYSNLGILYRIRGDLDEAKSLFQKALVLFDEMGAKLQIEKMMTLIDELQQLKLNTLD